MGVLLRCWHDLSLVECGVSTSGWCGRIGLRDRDDLVFGSRLGIDPVVLVVGGEASVVWGIYCRVWFLDFGDIVVGLRIWGRSIVG